MRGACQIHPFGVVAAAALAAALLTAAPANSAPSGAIAGKPAGENVIAEIQRAIDEQRYLDAATGINQAIVGSVDDPRLTVLTGELSLARSRYEDAITSFKTVESNPAVQARALQGEGIAMSQ